MKLSNRRHHRVFCYLRTVTLWTWDLLHGIYLPSLYAVDFGTSVDVVVFVHMYIGIYGNTVRNMSFCVVLSRVDFVMLAVALK